MEIDVCWWGCQLQEFFLSPGAIKHFNDWRRNDEGRLNEGLLSPGWERNDYDEKSTCEPNDHWLYKWVSVENG